LRASRNLGADAPRPVSLDIPEPSVNGSEISGVVLYVDSFGNLVTNIPAEIVRPDSTVHAGRRRIDRISGSYGEAGKGELLAIIGSAGLLRSR
jgi:S-adenosylmethionine hydrolase